MTIAEATATTTVAIAAMTTVAIAAMTTAAMTTPATVGGVATVPTTRIAASHQIGRWCCRLRTSLACSLVRRKTSLAG
jgi:hypothetical protein